MKIFEHFASMAWQINIKIRKEKPSKPIYFFDVKQTENER